MRTFEHNFDNLTLRRSLHRVWESICEGDRTRLVARWIDAKAEKSQSYENGDTKKDGGRSRASVSVCTSPNARPCLRRLRTSTVATAV